MRLATIWNSTPAWAALAEMKKPPKLAYRLAKYHTKVQREIAICQEQRNKIIYELAGMEAPKDGEVLLVDISSDPEKLAALGVRFQEFCQTESDLPWIGISMEELIEGLSVNAANALTENDIAILEPFFAEPPKAESPPTA